MPVAWDPESYLRYRAERDRPFHDLINRVPAQCPRHVVDLGCGTGHLTAVLADRWPRAQVTGLDSSPEMISGAKALPTRAGFAVADIRSWRPDPTVDVVVSNAALQWVPGHDVLLTRWASQLRSGSFIAVAVPNNFDAPSHRALREVAAGPRWAPRLGSVLRHHPVRDATGYLTLLREAGCAVDAWETTYLHQLIARPAADHPVLTWMEGTALRPVRAALADAGDAWSSFRAELGERLAARYPVRTDGQVYFPFHRIFFVAQTGANPEERTS